MPRQDAVSSSKNYADDVVRVRIDAEAGALLSQILAGGDFDFGQTVKRLKLTKDEIAQSAAMYLDQHPEDIGVWQALRDTGIERAIVKKKMKAMGRNVKSVKGQEEVVKPDTRLEQVVVPIPAIVRLVGLCFPQPLRRSLLKPAYNELVHDYTVSLHDVGKRRRYRSALVVFQIKMEFAFKFLGLAVEASRLAFSRRFDERYRH